MHFHETLTLYNLFFLIQFNGVVLNRNVALVRSTSLSTWEIVATCNSHSHFPLSLVVVRIGSFHLVMSYMDAILQDVLRVIYRQSAPNFLNKYVMKP